MCEEQQRLSVEEVVDSRGNIKSPSDEDNLEFIQQEQVQNSTVEQIVAVPIPRHAQYSLSSVQCSAAEPQCRAAE